MRGLTGALAVAAALAAAGCALPGRMGGASDGPTALPSELMQAGPQIVYQAPARQQVVGCVMVGYLIGRDGMPQDVTIQVSHPAGYFDAEVLNLMKVLSFKPRAEPEPRTRTFTFVPPQSGFTRETAASLCSASLSLPTNH